MALSLLVEMMEINLEPSISNCIETVAKREYERVLSTLLRGDQEDGQLEEELESLRLFLESANFGQLQSLSEELPLNGKRVEIILKSTNRASEYEIEINQV